MNENKKTVSELSQEDLEPIINHPRRKNWSQLKHEDKVFNHMPNFDSFVSRMWLDNCDENKAYLSQPLELEEYKTKYYDWLKKQYVLKHGVV